MSAAFRAVPRRTAGGQVFRKGIGVRTPIPLASKQLAVNGCILTVELQQAQNG